jgi:hydroxyacylglutathione hydrolase
MNDFDFLKHEKLNDRLYVIRESFLAAHNENIYVIVGDDKVGIFDSGMGVTCGLRPYIETYITDKRPMHCYVTHVDLDHLGGAALFDEVYLNHRDYSLLPWNLDVHRRFSDLKGFSNGNQKVLDYCSDRYVFNGDLQCKDIDQGDIIDLGGVELEVIRLIGHSDGSLGFYNREDNYIIEGDACSKHNFWVRCTDFKVALGCLNHVIRNTPEDVKIYHGHDIEVLSKSVFYTMKTAVEDLIAGRTQDDKKFILPFTFVHPSELKMHMKQHMVGDFMMAYNADILNNS